MQPRKALVILSLCLMIFSVFSPITVLAVSDDNTTLQNAKVALAIGYNSGDSAAGTKSNVTLPTLVNGVAVTWSSNNRAVIDDQGTVNRPAYLSGDETVMLTANLTYGTATPDSKLFMVKVLKLDPTDADWVAELKRDLQIGYEDGDSENYVTQNLIINSTGLGGTVDSIAWQSDNDSVIPIPNAVTGPYKVLIARPASGNATVVLKATITKGVVVETKTFTLTVIAASPTRTDAQIIDDTKTNLQIGYEDGDSSNHITQHIILDSTGLKSTLDSLTWSSDTPGVINISTDIDTGLDYVTVIRPNTGQPTVILTATFKKGAVQATKKFSLTVIGLDTITPVTTAAVVGTVGTGGWYTSGVTVTLNATDATVDDTVVTKYKITDGSGASGPEAIYSAPFTVYGDGTQTITYWSVDSTGNKEANKSLVFKVDTTAPVSSVNVVGLTADSLVYQNGSVNLLFSSTDTLGSGVAGIKYSLNGGPFTDITQGNPLNISIPGEYIVSYYAIDHVGNMEPVKTRSFKVLGPIPNVTGATYSITGESITLNWTNPNFEDFKHIVVRRGDGVEQTVIGNSFTDTNISANTSYTYTIIVVDAHNIQSTGVVVNAFRKALESNLAGLSLTPSTLSLQIGSTATTIATATYSDNSTREVTTNLTWNFTVSGIATISNGVVSAISPGTTVATATYGNQTAQLSITVTGYSTHKRGSGSSIPSVPSTPEPMEPSTVAPPTIPITPADNGNLSQVFSFLKDTVAQAKSNPAHIQFSDVTHHWNKDTINLFVKIGVVNGYEDGSFRPDSSITRAEFATIIAKLFNLQSDSTASVLSDVNNYWAKQAIIALASKGIIDGYEDGTFKPDKTITRAEIIAVMSRLVDLNGANKGNAGTFTDIAGTWNAVQIEAAAKAGIVEGRAANTFAPDASSTKAESLAIILRTLELNPEMKGLLNQLK